jgi:ribonucleoside-triphosphate reductase (thioredoxin)
MLPTDYQTYIHKSRYARWLDKENRRETWEETVSRYCDFWKERYPSTFPYEAVWESIYSLKVMPSMRALMTAGPALARDNIAGYNCSYIPVDDPRSFDEIMFILMNGTGVGYSVERQDVSKLPTVSERFHETDTCIVVADSKTGWAVAFRQLIALLYQGQIPKWDVSKVRPSGSRLKTFGGRASGPGPLEELFRFTVALFTKASGRRLSSIECSDLVCKTAEVVVVGGVRRSALICLSNLSDDRMRNYKNGQWWGKNKQRSLANISTAFTEKPEIEAFLKEWSALIESKSGERGIFNRVAAKKQAAATGRRNADFEFGTNPCGEIILRPYGFCNLSEVVIRAEDTLEDLIYKVRIASILGTFQSTLTDFRYLRAKWKQNQDEERLLGVSMTGIMDHPVLGEVSEQAKEWLSALKAEAIETNETYAAFLGINQSAAITTVKPSGTVSQLVDAASGIHPRHHAHYVRTVRADSKDPLAVFLEQAGVPTEVDLFNPNNLIFSFPIAAPAGAKTRNDVGAMKQLEHYLMFQQYWCEHNPSITVYVKQDEWLEVGAWVYKNLDKLGGVSFLPHSDHIYPQAPYQDIDQATYENKVEAFPAIDWEMFNAFEVDDSTVNHRELACIAGHCEI